jgi:hypothetical protein
MFPNGPSSGDRLFAISNLRQDLGLSPLEFSAEVERIQRNIASIIPAPATTWNHPSTADASVTSYPVFTAKYPPVYPGPGSISGHQPSAAVYQIYAGPGSVAAHPESLVSRPRNYPGPSSVAGYPNYPNRMNVVGGLSPTVHFGYNGLIQRMPFASPPLSNHLDTFTAHRHLPPNSGFFNSVSPPVPAVSFPPPRGSPSTGRSVVSDVTTATNKSNKSQKGVSKTVWTNIPGLPQYDSYEQLEAANAWSKPEAFGVFPFGTMAGSRFNAKKKSAQLAIALTKFAPKALIP